MRPRILYLIDNLLIGGAQTQMTRLVNGLGERDFDLRILCLGDAHERLLDQIGQERVAIYPMMCIWKPGFWVSYRKIRESVHAIKPDIVHAYLNTSNVFGAYAARRAGVPFIVTSRRDMGHFRSNRIAAMERWSNKFCHRVVCVSDAVKQQTVATEHLDPNKAVVLYSGVDTDLFKPRSRSGNSGGPLKVGMVAAMDRVEKGHRDFLDMAALVRQKNPNIQFVLVGGGCLHQDVERYAQQKGIRDAVDFKGRSTNVQQEMATFDLSIMASHTEGFSNAILEAMAMGIPVLAYAMEGNLEIISDGQDGLLVEPRNVSQMAGQILHYADRREELQTMGERARIKIEEQFTLKHMVGRYKSFYNEMLSTR